MSQIRRFESAYEMARFLEPFENWPATGRPLGARFEGTIEAIYRGCLKVGDAAIDGGACHGRHTLPLADVVGPEGCVIGIDANPEALDVLRPKAAVLPQAHIEFAALGDGDADLEFSVVVNNPGRSSLVTVPALTNLKKFSVRQRKIDDLDTGGRRVRFIKLDLEGGEIGALRGARRTLAEDRPVICLEHLKKTMPLFGVTYDDYFGFFEELNYDLIDILGNAFTREVASWDNWKPSYLVALPRGDTHLSRRAVEALKTYADQIYGHIPGWRT